MAKSYNVMVYILYLNTERYWTLNKIERVAKNPILDFKVILDSHIKTLLTLPLLKKMV
jgi:hypothetical protein